MGLPATGTSASEAPPESRLDSWKEIAAYLRRDVTTVQRWERREGMPVRRHRHAKRGSVYAIPAELDAWLATRSLKRSEEARTTASPEANESGPARAGTRRARLWIGVAAAVAVLALLVMVEYLSPSRVPVAPSTQIHSLAVLPLKNLSGDPAQQYIADGITDALIGRLSGLRNLRVISDTTVMRFKNSHASMPEIARALGVDAVMEGSVIREGNRIRVTAQLIRGANDQHFWSESYDREFRDVLALESDVAEAITERVQVTLTGEERQRLQAARPVAPEVYESYLQGWYAMQDSPTRADIERSIAYFNGAIGQDPTFAPAYVGLAAAYNQMDSSFLGGEPQLNLARMATALRKALQIDPNLAEAHVLLGEIERQRWQWTESEAEYRRALQLAPHDALARMGLAWWLVCQGRMAEALPLAQRARELDPFTISGDYLAWLLIEARQFPEAERELRAVLAVRSHDAVALWDLGIDLIDENRAREAIPLLQKSLALSGRSPGVMASLIAAYARAGQTADARKLMSELNRRRGSGYVPTGPLVKASVALGQYNQAFAWLERAYREHSGLLQYLKVDPDLDPIRGDPRFAAMLRRIG